MYQMFRSQFLAFSIYQSESWFSICLFHLVFIWTPKRNSGYVDLHQTHNDSVAIYNLCSRLSPVSPVLLPEWLLVQASSSGGEKSAGPHSGWALSCVCWNLVRSRSAICSSSFICGLSCADLSISCSLWIFWLCRGIPVLDVERIDFPSAVSLFWSRKSDIFSVLMLRNRTRTVSHRRAPFAVCIKRPCCCSISRKAGSWWSLGQDMA